MYQIVKTSNWTSLAWQKVKQVCLVIRSVICSGVSQTILIKRLVLIFDSVEAKQFEPQNRMCGAEKKKRSWLIGISCSEVELLRQPPWGDNWPQLAQKPFCHWTELTSSLRSADHCSSVSGSDMQCYCTRQVGEARQQKNANWVIYTTQCFPE